MTGHGHRRYPPSPDDKHDEPTCRVNQYLLPPGVLLIAMGLGLAVLAFGGPALLDSGGAASTLQESNTPASPGEGWPAEDLDALATRCVDDPGCSQAPAGCLLLLLPAAACVALGVLLVWGPRRTRNQQRGALLAPLATNGLRRNSDSGPRSGGKV